MCCKAADPTPAEVVRGTAGVRKGFNVPRMEHRKVRKFKGAGIELNCVDYGGEGRPPMLLVHGGAAHARWWDFVAPALTGRFHVLALDQRGHGDSPWTAQWAYGSRHYAADLEAVTDGWGLGAPVLVGHSMGGHSVMVYAVEHSQRLRAMVAIDSIPAYPEHAISALAAIADRPASIYESLEDALLLPAAARPAAPNSAPRGGAELARSRLTRYRHYRSTRSHRRWPQSPIVRLRSTNRWRTRSPPSGCCPARRWPRPRFCATWRS